MPHLGALLHIHVAFPATLCCLAALDVLYSGAFFLAVSAGPALP